MDTSTLTLQFFSHEIRNSLNDSAGAVMRKGKDLKVLMTFFPIISSEVIQKVNGN